MYKNEKLIIYILYLKELIKLEIKINIIVFYMILKKKKTSIIIYFNNKDIFFNLIFLF